MRSPSVTASIVGREPELAAGERFLAALAAGPASLVFEGAAGIGKSTVWAEVVRRAHADLQVRLAARTGARLSDEFGRRLDAGPAGRAADTNRVGHQTTSERR